MTGLKILGIVVLSIIALVIIIYSIIMKFRKWEISNWRIGDELSFTYDMTREINHAKSNPLKKTNWKTPSVKLLKWNLHNVEVEYGDGVIRVYGHGSIKENMDYQERLQQQSFDDFMEENVVDKKREERNNKINEILNN
jgi:hypothetical protein